VLPLR
ncbi:hypothetical protein D041_0288B, partial [Vibrio parahaemolyticus EKP-008]